MRHPLILTLLLLALAGTSWWLAGENDNAPAAEHIQGKREVDYYLRGLDATTMNLQGKPARTLKAAELRHFSDDKTSQLLKPRMLVYQKVGPPWQIASEHGTVSGDGSLVLLQGAVHLQRDAWSDHPPITVDTRNVRVQPRQDYAETDEKVRVRSNEDRIDATGMQAWFRQPARIKFLADVKGFYAPPK
jgi:lipopolysaccharide export system protein LptC